jgi:hypothetical protein
VFRRYFKWRFPQIRAPGRAAQRSVDHNRTSPKQPWRAERDPRHRGQRIDTGCTGHCTSPQRMWLRPSFHAIQMITGPRIDLPVARVWHGLSLALAGRPISPATCQ